MVADSTQAVFVKVSPNRKDLQRMAGGKAATSQTCSLAQMGSDPPGGPGLSCDSQLETPPAARSSSSGTIITWAWACPQDPQETGAKLIWAPHFAVTVPEIHRVPQGQGFQAHAPKGAQIPSQLCPRSKAQGQRTVPHHLTRKQTPPLLQPQRLVRVPRGLLPSQGSAHQASSSCLLSPISLLVQGTTLWRLARTPAPGPVICRQSVLPRWAHPCDCPSTSWPILATQHMPSLIHHRAAWLEVLFH